MLAVLLLQANHTVPVEHLIDQLWGESAPASATAMLQAYVCKLRKALRPRRHDDDDVRWPALLTEPSGYRLQVEPDQVDLYCFERLVARGRQAMASGDPHAAASLLREALALWRGPALAGMDPERLGRGQSAAVRLEESRMIAIEERVDAELACGRHAELVGELTELVAEHPLRERLHGQLLRALAQSGRRGDALLAYRRARDTLVAELGLEPSMDLQRLQQAILTGTPVASESGAAGGADDHGGAGPGSGVTTMGGPAAAALPGTGCAHDPPLPTPAQLPPAPADFTGRAAPARHLESMLRRPEEQGADPIAGVVCGIFGPAGVGKTTLALYVAQRVRSVYPGGQLFVDLRGAGPDPANPGEVLAGFLRALGVDQQRLPDSDEERAGLFRSLTADRRLLVVLDNARDALQIRPLLPGGAGSSVLLTSRTAITTLPGLRLVDLKVLARPEAVALLGRIEQAGRVLADPSAAALIARRCGYLPLALRVVGARLAADPALGLPAVAQRLADEHRRLAELDLGDLSVRASLTLSYQTLYQPGQGPDHHQHHRQGQPHAPDHVPDLPPDRCGGGGDACAARAFRLLGVVAGADIDLLAAARVLDIPPQQCETVLDQLIQARLLDLDRNGRYRMHDLVRLYARERAAVEEPYAQTIAAQRRLLRWYMGTAQQATRLLRPASNLEHTDEIAVEAGMALHRVDDAFAWFAAERSNLAATIRHAVASECPASRLLGIQLTIALRWLVRSQGLSEDWEQLLEAALGASRQMGQEHLAAQLLNELVNVCMARGNLDGMLRHSEGARRAYGNAGQRHGEIGSIINLGTAHHLLGQVETAVSLYKEALAGAAAIGYRRGEGYALANLAAGARDLGDADSAIRYGTRALDAFRQINDRQGQADALDDLAASYRAGQRLDDALVAHQQCLAVLDDLADRPRRAQALLGLAHTQITAGKPRTAAAAAEQAVSLLVDAGHPRLHSQALLGLGDALHACGDTDTAHLHWQQAQTILTSLTAVTASPGHTTVPGASATTRRCGCARQRG